MSFGFGTQMSSVFGTLGEFFIPGNGRSINVRYLVTKIRPGTQGNWENELASMMVPWREVFKVEELTFDELLQRDLDDSRVAHELIPYLLGQKGDAARFFPPVLAIVVPRKERGSGIRDLYPSPKVLSEAPLVHNDYSDIFTVKQIEWAGQPTPFAELQYNRQRSAFVIVDGQHRAMAVLALHRQLNESWGSNAFASYYHHIKVTPEQVRSIELPVCIAFIPELYEGSPSVADGGINLKTVCREIFLVVNKNAKPVSRSRELLLDDEDFAARLMRHTLSLLKDRSAHDCDRARIYSVAYGDSDGESGGTVVQGTFQVASAVALHRLHAALSFGRPDIYSWKDPAEATDMRNLRNPSTPAEILVGTDLDHLDAITRMHGRTLPYATVQNVVSLLGNLNNLILMSLLDNLQPFQVHNQEVLSLKHRLSDVDARADLVQSKCYTLLFEGSGVREVFNNHLDVLKSLRDDARDRGAALSQALLRQISWADTVTNALAKHEKEFQRRRACRLLNISYEAYTESGTEKGWQDIERWARALYQTLSTQAFQLGYCMAIMSIVRHLLPQGCGYDWRLSVTRKVCNLMERSFNRFLSPSDTTVHRTLTGFIDEKRAHLFDPAKPGLRGLLRMSTSEINERRWDFFRYCAMEIWLSRIGSADWLPELHVAQPGSELDLIRAHLPAMVQCALALRQTFTDKAVKAALNSNDYRLERERVRAEAIGRGCDEGEVGDMLIELELLTEERAQKQAAVNIEASLGAEESYERMCQRLGV
jgi:hypothetical protein